MDDDHLSRQIQQVGGLARFYRQRTMLEKMNTKFSGLPEEETRWQHFMTLQGNGRSRSFWRDFLLMLPLFPALALRVKRRYGLLVLKQPADVTRRGVKQVKGFGDHLTQAVIDWKASCERRFVFRPNEAITPADRQAVMAKMTANDIGWI